jgi:hypothetical protein
MSRYTEDMRKMLDIADDICGALDGIFNGVEISVYGVQEVEGEARTYIIELKVVDNR